MAYVIDIKVELFTDNEAEAQRLAHVLTEDLFDCDAVNIVATAVPYRGKVENDGRS